MTCALAGHPVELLLPHGFDKSLCETIQFVPHSMRQADHNLTPVQSSADFRVLRCCMSTSGKLSHPQALP